MSSKDTCGNIKETVQQNKIKNEETDCKSTLTNTEFNKADESTTTSFNGTEGKTDEITTTSINGTEDKTDEITTTSFNSTEDKTDEITTTSFNGTEAKTDNKFVEKNDQKVENSDLSLESDNVKKAESIKLKANEFFKKQEYDKAIDLYTEAIELNPNEPIFFSNRSLAYFRVEAFGYALKDANKTIELNDKYYKGYFRRAITLMALGKFQKALKDFELLAKTNINDKTLYEKYKMCLKVVKKVAFEKAIRVDDKSVAETIDIDSLEIDASYTGPKMSNDKLDFEFMKEAIETFKKDKLIHKKYAYKIIFEAQKLFKTLPSLVDVTIPENKKFTVCGDIHGQFFDLVNIFEINGYPSTENPYLFNGDFVDRGSYSVECILTLLGFKVLFPNHFHMTRGNHESQEMNQIYGFESEVKSKYSSLMYDFLSETFEMLPLCYCLNKKILVMHGGLPKEEVSLDEIRKLDRFRKPPNTGLMCDLLWSDPTRTVDEWTESKRGVGIQFGVNITERFCKKNNLDYIIRSHEVKMQGYDKMHNDKCITIFSAPNYCGTIGNLGAYIIINSSDLVPKFHTFQAESSATIKPMAYASKLFSYMT